MDVEPITTRTRLPVRLVSPEGSSAGAAGSALGAAELGAAALGAVELLDPEAQPTS